MGDARERAARFTAVRHVRPAAAGRTVFSQVAIEEGIDGRDESFGVIEPLIMADARLESEPRLPEQRGELGCNQGSVFAAQGVGEDLRRRVGLGERRAGRSGSIAPATANSATALSFTCCSSAASCA